MIDIGINLTNKQFRGDRNAVVERAKDTTNADGLLASCAATMGEMIGRASPRRQSTLQSGRIGEQLFLERRRKYEKEAMIRKIERIRVKTMTAPARRQLIGG